MFMMSKNVKTRFRSGSLAGASSFLSTPVIHVGGTHAKVWFEIHSILYYKFQYSSPCHGKLLVIKALIGLMFHCEDLMS